MRIWYLMVAVVCAAAVVGRKARSKRCNHGTVLFSKSDVWKTRWTKREIGLVFSRWYFNHLFPPPFQHDRINVYYIQNLVSYFQQAFTTIDNVAVDKENNEIMTAALCDTVGSYLKASALPAVKCSYYAGNIAYPAAARLFQIYDDIKRYLDTDGKRWHSGSMDCRLHIRNSVNLVKRHLITRVKYPCRQLSSLKKLPNGKLWVPTPRVRWNREASVIKLPLANESTYPLDSPEAASDLLFYYVVAHDCLKPKSSSFQHFKDNFVDWFTYDVEPHLSDDRLYPGLGGVLFLVDNDNIESAYVNKATEDDDFKFISDSVNQKTDSYNWSSALMIISLIIIVELLWCIPTMMCMWCYKKKRKHETRYSRLDVEHARNDNPISPYPVKRKKKSNLKTSIKTKDDVLNEKDAKDMSNVPSRSETRLEIVRFNKSANVMTQMSHRSTVDNIPKHSRGTDAETKHKENRHAYTDADLIKISEVSTSLPSIDKQLFLVDEQSGTPSLEQVRSIGTNDDERYKTTVAHDREQYFFQHPFSITDPSNVNNFRTSNDKIIFMNKCLETKKKVSYPEFTLADFPDILSNESGLLIEEVKKPSDLLIISSSTQENEPKSKMKELLLSFENMDKKFAERTTSTPAPKVIPGADPQNATTSMHTTRRNEEAPSLKHPIIKNVEITVTRNDSGKCFSQTSQRSDKVLKPSHSTDISDSCESTHDMPTFRNLANSKSKSATVNTVTALNLIRTMSVDPFIRDGIKCKNKACACQTICEPKQHKKTQQFVGKKMTDKKRCFEIEVDLPSNTDVYVELEGLKLPKPSKIPKIRYMKKDNVHFGPSTLTTMPCAVQPTFRPGTRIPVMKRAKDDAALRKRKRNVKPPDLNSTL